ncbi:septum formation initiator family protein [bacterium]|jgi:cell division protein FtsB|nr:septum formation initiator family protein [bacterium]MBT4122010.1 septum formation initiator family protein [bacterium]MBT4334932.1 septum formation initiator family protein [bacterium]MBT4495355.1 septum formation initiator family protein [bacterium]MBT4764164.1 septum formation initiator family protein [bacterium]
MVRNSNIGKQLFNSKSLLFVSLLILVFFSFNLINEVINRRELQSDIKALDEEISKLENKNQELSSLIGYFETLDFVEKEARTKLNLRKPGEKIIVITEDELTEDNESFFDSAVLTSANIIHLTNPQKWWNYFFNIN